MNTVNPDNFNETMFGYVQRALDETAERLKEKGYTAEQIEEVCKTVRRNLYYAVDVMTMRDAREYEGK